ncbi:ABC transporter family substrate-binding protein [Sanguibacter suaedae]|uniref:ABC transporter family substrate-binding protein n=1 Tax=Sanguibacter suaedae TaxID=2795737 RepID=A0A934ICD9_9MICO|nr:ABC transporter family substrate-binding protein [Sanguibacter suaedae]MBI9115200.1 ABC transporter family substrate-binding protein [Sanguibacter suaedae]
MRITNTAAPIALLAGGALLLSACSGGTEEVTETESAGASDVCTTSARDDSVVAAQEGAPVTPEVFPEGGGTGKEALEISSTADDEIFYSVGQDEWSGYNGAIPENYDVYTSVVNARTASGFIYYGTDGEVHVDPEFGSVEKIADDPLTVRYTINDAAVWSDGTPLDYDDMVLDWAITTYTGGNLNYADHPECHLFNSVSGSYGEYAPNGPEGEIGGKEFVVTFKEPYADWKLLVGGLGQWYPAHVVAEQIGLSADELTQAILDEDFEVIAEAADFFNTGWANPAPGELPDESLIPVAGPYKFGTWVAGQSITLEANENYWGTPAATQRLTFRFAEPSTHVQALANGDLDVIEPQPTVDTLTQLEGVANASILTGDTLTWEHLDLNHRDGPFAESMELREAFAMCVPRQQIVDNLVKPINPEAVVMNAREVFPFQENYDEVVSESYDGRYDEVDLDGARAKIAESGVATPIDVRIGYVAGNTRRADEVALIKSSCDQAGFNITDVSSATYMDEGGERSLGDYEVSLFAWAGSGQVASGANIYVTDNPQNWNWYSNEDVDAAWKTLESSVDPEVHLEQTKIIEKGLWDDLHGIPLFAHPGLVGADSSIQNVRKTATQNQVVWNAEQWVR